MTDLREPPPKHGEKDLAMRVPAYLDLAHVRPRQRIIHLLVKRRWGQEVGAGGGDSDIWFAKVLLTLSASITASASLVKLMRYYCTHAS